MKKKAANRRHLVAALVFDGVAPFELAIACEVFGIDRSDDLGVEWYRFLVCAVGRSPVTAQTGFRIDTPYGLETLAEADTIVIPANVGESTSPELLEALRDANRRGARILSVCTGAFTLAAAGLLDGRPATTHWMYAERLARDYPLVKVDPGVLYVDDVDILTSAGTAAGIDLCLHVVRKDFGATVANAVARRMVVPPHREGGQAQYVDEPLRPKPAEDLFSDTLNFLERHLREPLSVAALAERSVMSPRTFARRFRATTGTTPVRWLVSQRVLRAQRLLETTDLSIETIAQECGMGTATNLRQHFHRVLRTSPIAYRRTFREQIAPSH